MNAKAGRFLVVASFVTLALGAAAVIAVDLVRREYPALAQSGPGRGSGDPPARGRMARSIDGLYLSARVAELGKDYEGALAQVEQAFRRSPDDPYVQLLTFRLRLLAGKIPAAAELASKVLPTSANEGQPASSEGLPNLTLAVMAIRKGDFKAAESYAANLGDEASTGLMRPIIEAWLKVAQKDFEAARGRLEAARPDDEALMGMFRIHEALIDEAAGDREAAVRKLREIVKSDEQAPLRAVMVLAGVLRRAGKTDEAREMLRKYGEANADAVVLDGLIRNDSLPRQPTAADMIADILLDIGGAIATAQRENAGDLGLVFTWLALELSPTSDNAHLLAADLLEGLNQPEKAIAQLTAVDSASPLQWRARMRAAALLAEVGKVDDAVKGLQAMVAERPERIDAAAALGDLLRGKERFAEAAKAYDTAVDRLHKPEDRHWALFYARGITRERIKNWPAAESDFRRALSMVPPVDEPKRRSRGFVLNYLGYSWIDQGVNLDEGLKLLMEAVELVPNDGAITDSLGWAYYRLGKYDLAVALLEKAIQLKADDATIVEHLGDAYWHVGRQREARFQWERALRQKPEPDRVEPLNRKLAEGLTKELDQPTIIRSPAEAPAADKPAEKK
ncbi:tetratricopeptide repeat protein [Reyranella sp. CPCC 100927]|uniref:tetratricopeptide repeat protein n=1 Tax=Reyranella sp. CPCC 100927 TaxID=2599616 RepID=UPI0011B491DD|nr:tetratricopeptide repeat protein [Reyranella sp. CPCC 100927]TWT02815.1 tetratricopeptide repeat protein [Reyranella sp. CPCC 100927]